MTRGRLWRFGWEHRVRDDPAVSGATQEALLVMATFADPDGTLRIGEKRIARCLCKSEKTAQRAVTAALKTGYLERLSRGHNVPGRDDPEPSTYRLTLPRADAAPDREDVELPNTRDRLWVVGDTGEGDERTA